MKTFLLISLLVIFALSAQAGAGARVSSLTPSSVHENECNEGDLGCMCDDNGWCWLSARRRMIDCYNEKDRELEFDDGECQCKGNTCQWVQNGTKFDYYVSQPANRRAMYTPIVQSYLAPHHHHTYIAASPGY